MRFQLDSYLDCMQQKRLLGTLIKLNPLAEGKELLAQGQKTTNFFIIVHGTADVFLHGVRVRTLLAGACCGELAAMEAKSRSATIVATSPLEVLTGNARVFKLFFGQQVATKRTEWRPFLGGLRLCVCPGYEDQPLNDHIGEYGLDLLADALTTREVAAGELLGTAMGSQWDSRVYLVVEGEVEDEQQHLFCRTGQAFGQLEVLQATPSRASRRAVSAMRVAVVDAEAFVRLVPKEATLGPAALAVEAVPPAAPPRPTMSQLSGIWTTAQMLDGVSWEGQPRAPTSTCAEDAQDATPGLSYGVHSAQQPYRHRERGLLNNDAEVADREARRLAGYETLLQKIPVLHGLTKSQRQRLLDALEEVSFDAGTPIAVEGKPTSHLYLLLSGRVTLYKRTSGEVGSCKAGDYFGERSLTCATPAQAIPHSTRIHAHPPVLVPYAHSSLQQLQVPSKTPLHRSPPYHTRLRRARQIHHPRRGDRNCGHPLHGAVRRPRCRRPRARARSASGVVQHDLRREDGAWHRLDMAHHRECTLGACQVGAFLCSQRQRPRSTRRR